MEGKRVDEGTGAERGRGPEGGFVFDRTVLHPPKLLNLLSSLFDVKLNNLKSVVTRIGERFDVTCVPLMLCGR